MTFFATFEIAEEVEDLTLRLYTAEYSNSTIYVNGEQVIETGYVQCHGEVFGANLGYYNKSESCCKEARTATIRVSKN